MKRRNTKRKISLRKEVQILDQSLRDRKNYNELEHRCLLVERNYEDLRRRLVSLLSKEQIDAAKTCGITPEVYALEWIQIYKDGLRQYAPAFGDHVKSLVELRMHQNG